MTHRHLVARPMKITCENCKTRFLLDDARIPPQGAKVRCSRCQHRFHVKPPPSPLTPDEIVSKVVEDNAPEGVDLAPPSKRPEPAPPAAPAAASQPPGPSKARGAKAPAARPRAEGRGEAEAALDNPEFLFDEPTPPEPPPPPDPDFEPPLVSAAPAAKSLPPKKRAEPAAPAAAPSQQEPSLGGEDQPPSDEPDDLGEEDDDPALGAPEPLPDGRDALFGDGSSYLSEVPEDERSLDEEASAAPSGLDVAPSGGVPLESESEGLGDEANWSDLDIDPGVLPPRPPPLPSPVAAARFEARPAVASSAPGQGVEALEQPAWGRVSAISIRLVALSASLLLLAGAARAWWVLGGAIPRGPAVVAGAGWEASDVEAFHARGDSGRALVIHGSLSSTAASAAPEVAVQLLDVDGMPVGAPVRGSLLGDRTKPLALEGLRAGAAAVPPGGRGVRGFAVVIPEPPPAAARYRLMLTR